MFIFIGIFLKYDVFYTALEDPLNKSKFQEDKEEPL